MCKVIPDMGDINGRTEFRACKREDIMDLIETIKFDECLV